MFHPIVARVELAFLAMDAPPPQNTPELDGLFARLRAAGGRRERTETASRIWSLWCTHPEAEATEAMRSVIDAFDFGDFKSIEETLDGMAERWPGWAEVWNKRATLRFAADRDVDSLDDIVRTLEREPRHFGALSGLGQICVRAGLLTSAMLTFERVLHIDPGMADIKDAVAALRKEARHSVH